MEARFCHLRVRSDFSVLNSSIKIDVIGDYAKHENSLALCLMDDINLSGGLAFCYAMKDCKTKPLIGLNVFVYDEKYSNERSLPYIGLIAKNEVGYKNLLKIVYHAYKHNESKHSFDQKCLRLQDLKQFSEGLICLTGGFRGLIGQEYLHFGENFALAALKTLDEFFKNNLYIELTRHGRTKERELENFLIKAANEMNLPLVATNDVHFQIKDHFDAFDALSCVKQKALIFQEERDKLNHEYYLKSEKEMIDLFSDIPEAIANTVQVAKRCNYFIEKQKPRLPSFSTGDVSEFDVLKEKSLSGLAKHLEKVETNLHNSYYDRLNYELEIINRMGFCGYFLIVADFINWAKSQGIAVGPGRGSGAGSIIAWSIGITNADPVKYGLIFERFLNPERVSMPDFDIDFCQSRRGEVIDYVVQKYGNDKVSSIITYGKLQAKAVLKDVARVMQIPFPKVDAISKMIPFNPLDPVTLEKAIQMDPKLRDEIQKDDEIKELVNIGMILEGLNRHSSTHAAGVIIADRNLLDVAPLYTDEGTELPILGYDMKDAEKVGLMKFDFLGLKTMTVVSEACKLIKQTKGDEIDIDNLEYNDKKTFDLLASGFLKGVFQLESVIARNALTKIHVHSLEEIADITSLIRPGPMENLPNYIRRKNGEEKIDCYYDVLKELLEQSCGIIIYQEQVVEVARLLANYSRGEGDLLRRAMGKKIKEEMDKQCEIFVKKATDFGVITAEQAEKMFYIIAKFAGYGFNKAHAIAYSIISYYTAYLKANYPVEFITTSLNLDLDDSNTVSAFVNDARRLKIEIKTPDINHSQGNFSCKDGVIFYGLNGIKGIGENVSREIVLERERGGNFQTLEDFLTRCCNIVNKKVIEALIKSGSLDCLGKRRKTMIENIGKLVDFASDLSKGKVDKSVGLFDDDSSSGKLQLKEFIEYNEMELLNLEFEVFGFYLSKHPLEKYSQFLNDNNVVWSDEVSALTPNTNDETNVMMCGTVIKVVQRFKGKTRFAFLHLVDLEGVYETMIFKDEIIISNRENLVEGANLVLSVNVKNGGDYGVRMSVNRIFKVDDVFQNQELLKEVKTYTPSKNKSNYNYVKKDVQKNTPAKEVSSESVVQRTIQPKKPNVKTVYVNSIDDLEKITQNEDVIAIFDDGTQMFIPSKK
ncbi:MAG: polymerase alpha subunit [Pseudomonadota bacterium]